MKRILLIISVLMFCNLALAENKPAAAKAANAGFDTLSFDNKQEHLPPYYRGHSIELFQETALKNNVFSKGKSEFETAPVYEERKRVTFVSMNFGIMNASSKWAFMYDPEDSLTYDPELTQFSFPIMIGGDEPSIVVERKRKVVGSYIAQNAMGAKAKVTKLDILTMGLQFSRCQKPNPDFDGKLEYRDGTGDYVHNFSMPPDKAKIQKTYLRYLLVVDGFEPPYIETSSSHSEPEFPNDLYEANLRTITTYVRLEAIWLYNYKTGEIIEKIAPCSIKQEHQSMDIHREVLNYLF